MGRGGRPWRGVKVVVIYSVLCNHVYLAFLHVCFYVFCFTILPISGREYALKNYKNCIKKNTKIHGDMPNIHLFYMIFVTYRCGLLGGLGFRSSGATFTIRR